MLLDTKDFILGGGTMSKIKALIFCIVSFLLGYLSFQTIPIAWLLATNTMKGKVNNPEGELFIPLGIFLFLLILIVTIGFYFILYKNIKSEKKWKYFTLVIPLFLLGSFLATLTWNNYSAYPHLF